MPSLTPLHETYCRWDRTPPSQADILEGLAQLVSTRLNAVMSEVIQTIQREVLLSVFGMSEQRSQKFQKTPTFQKLYKFAFHSLQQYGYHFVAPGLRQIIAQFPNLHDKALTPSLHFLVGVLNGVLGDYLLEQQNPLALPMVLYDHYGEVQQGDLSGRVVIFAHGLCRNHFDCDTHQFGGFGEKLLAQRDHNTMLYLNYNTGRAFLPMAAVSPIHLDDLIQRHPKITSIDLIGQQHGRLGEVFRAVRCFTARQNSAALDSLGRKSGLLGLTTSWGCFGAFWFPFTGKIRSLPDCENCRAFGQYSQQRHFQICAMAVCEMMTGNIIKHELDR